MTHNSTPSPTIQRLEALVAGLKAKGGTDTAAVAAREASTRASLQSQISTAGLYSVEQLYTQRQGMLRGIPFVQYLRSFVQLSYDIGEDAAVDAFRADLEQARANDEPSDWAF